MFQDFFSILLSSILSLFLFFSSLHFIVIVFKFLAETSIAGISKQIIYKTQILIPAWFKPALCAA